MAFDLILRADASNHIGCGHVMRCLAIAEAWKDIGGRVTLWTQQCPEILLKAYVDEGFTVVRHSDQSPNDRKRFLAQYDNIALLLDGYHLPDTWQDEVAEENQVFAVIHDFCQWRRYGCDAIINPNIYGKTTVYPNVSSKTSILAGGQYALLRRQFAKYIPLNSNTRFSSPPHILVSCGGADLGNMTRAVIASLDALKRSDIHVNVLIGPSNTRSDSEIVPSSARHYALRITRENLSVAPLMSSSSLGIFAGGGILLEAACRGLPSIAFATAENQNLVLEGFATLVKIHPHPSADHKVETLTCLIRNMINDVSGLEQLSFQLRRAVDGFGALRVAEFLQGKGVSLREIREEDCEQLWEWTNEPDVRKASFRSQAISFKEHQLWFSQKLSESSTKIYFASTFDDRSVGVIRFEECQDKCPICSISIDPKWRGRGYGLQVLQSGIRYLSRALDVCEIRAFVQPENCPSIRMFLTAGFHKIEKVTRHGREAVLFSLKLRDS